MNEFSDDDLEIDDDVPQEDSSAEEAKPGVSPVRVVVRIIVGGALIVALVLAWLDFRQKRAAEGTFRSWDDKRYEIEETGKDMRRSDVDVLIQGNPATRSGKPGKEHRFARSETKYTWDGPIRDYSVTIYYGLGADDPIVEEISPIVEETSWESPAEP